MKPWISYRKSWWDSLQKVVLLTGGSKGIGYATAKSFAEKGCRIYEISRSDIPNPGVIHITGDVTDKASVEAAVSQIMAREDRIDVLVCNAGTVISGAIEFTEMHDIKKLMELNFYGMVNTVCAVIPIMRKTGGRIICLSSMAAVFPVPFQAYYSASKAAVSAYTFALANEVKDFGISICAVLPGDTKTEPIRTKIYTGDDVYGGKIERSVKVMEHDEANGMAPDKVGRFVSKVALKKRVKPYYVVGFIYKLEYFLSRILPAAAARMVVGMIYTNE